MVRGGGAATTAAASGERCTKVLWFEKLLLSFVPGRARRRLFSSAGALRIFLHAALISRLMEPLMKIIITSLKLSTSVVALRFFLSTALAWRNTGRLYIHQERAVLVSVLHYANLSRSSLSAELGCSWISSLATAAC